MRQTSIRPTASAREALARLCARSGTKVEPTVRRLLEQFVEHQQALDEERRLTHLAIALGHPPGTRLPGDPPPTERLAIRLPIELQRAAESFAYRIPGRPARQSHRDYASRPLSGAVTIAIALAEPFQEPQLVGLPILVEHRLGDGLWRLTVAASLTGEERRALTMDPAPLPQMLVDDEVMWHSPERSALARQIATNLLAGPGAADHLAILSAQQEDFQEWIQELTDPRVIYGGHTISDGAAPLGGNKEGRASTAIWRARRILALEELAAWLAGDNPAPTLELDPPSWTLTMPPGWHTVRFPRNSPAPAALHAEWKQGHVLRIDSGRRRRAARDHLACRGNRRAAGIRGTGKRCQRSHARDPESGERPDSEHAGARERGRQERALPDLRDRANAGGPTRHGLPLMMSLRRRAASC